MSDLRAPAERRSEPLAAVGKLRVVDPDPQSMMHLGVGTAMSMETSKALKCVRDAVTEYCDRYSIFPRFEISELYDLRKDWSDKAFPFADDHGCYVFYSSRGLLHIGKASSNTLGAEISSHFVLDYSRAVPKTEWPDAPISLQTIRVHEPYEAASLHEYLLRTVFHQAGKPMGLQRRGRDLALVLVSSLYSSAEMLCNFAADLLGVVPEL